MTAVFRENRSIVWLAVVTALILAVPLVGMQFTDEVVWGPIDFVFAAVAIFGSGLAFILIARQMQGNVHRAGLAVASERRS